MTTARSSRVPRTIPLLIAVCLVSFPAYAKYSGGTGEPSDPYQIATAADLILLGETPDDYGKHFILTADIDLDPNLPGRKVFDRAVIAPDTINSTNQFQGIPFTGVFDGSEHTVSHLTISGDDYLGLFGQLGSGATISNLALEAVNVNGGFCVGGLVGHSNDSNISNCYSTGSVAGRYSVGGLAGSNNGTITSSYSTGMVTGEYSVGGLVGRNAEDDDATITVSYSAGSVTGDRKVGGLVGSNSNRGSITMSYSTGTASGERFSVGGLVGSNEGRITMSYSTGAVTGNSDVGGLVGSSNPSNIASSFWDMETSGQPTSAGGTGLTTPEMQDIDTYLSEGWDFVDETLNGTCDYWQISPGDYPMLRYPVMPEGLGTVEEPYLIRGIRDLGTVWFKPLAHYRLETSVDLSGITWSMAVVPWFEGTFEGNGHVISNLHIQGGMYLGLFGQLGHGAKISGLGLDAVSVEGTSDYVGGLAGRNYGIITSSHSTGTVGGEFRVGGLVGHNETGSITSSYSTGTVTGGGTCGGLIGYNYKGSVTSCYSSCEVTESGSIQRGGVGGLVGHNDRGSITASYSTGSVSDGGGLVGWNEGYASITASYSTGSVSDGGGLVGFNEAPSLTSSSFWDIETSGQMGSDGGFGLTTIEMMDPEMLGLHGLLTNDPNWVLDAGRDYPRLAWEGTAGQIIPEPVIDWLDGQGTEEEPYRIDTADQLILFGRAGMLWDKYFILGADINLDPNLQGGRVFSRAVITSFDGVFDGNDHTISHLTISGDDYLGLFGQLGSGATISNLALEAVNVNGGFCVGGLVGHSNDSNISNCYCTGVVAGEMNVGGLAGDNVGNIANCYSSGTVAATESVGGLVGDNHGIITTCYSTGSVTGYEDVGGLVGRNDDAAATIATITMSYSTGAVTGDRTVGGLVGSNSNGGSITMSHSTGAVTGNNDVGGLVGEIDGSITASYWDIQASGEPNMCGNAEDPSCDNSYGKTTAEMQTESTFTEAGWDFVGETENGTEDVWWILEGQDYPRLWWETDGN